jgi:hypothetical protein
MTGLTGRVERIAAAKRSDAAAHSAALEGIESADAPLESLNPKTCCKQIKFSRPPSMNPIRVHWCPFAVRQLVPV